MPRRSNHSRLYSVGLVVITVLVIAGCAPITVTPAARSQGSPAAVSSTSTAAASRPATVSATAAATASTAGPAVFAGTVKHAGQPVPEARVELRALGWATRKTPPLATIQADAKGNFTLTNPPVGDFSVVGYFPDGEMDAGGWPPVSIRAGQPVKGFVVPLERKLILLSPIAGSAAPATLTFKWNPAVGATEYRLLLIDPGTTDVKLDTTTKETTAPGPSDLAAGEYEWVVNGIDAGGQIVATGQETFVVKAAGAAETPGPQVTETQGPTSKPGNMPRLPDEDRAFEGAREALAKRLGVDPLAVQRVQVTAQEWNDACLGVNNAGEMCAQVITPGWIVILEAGGQRYEAHTNQEGTSVRLVGLK